MMQGRFQKRIIISLQGKIKFTTQSAEQLALESKVMVVIEIKCPACQVMVNVNTVEKTFYPSDNKEVFSCGKPSDIFFCHKCGLGSAYPMPSQLALTQYYADRRYWKYEKVNTIRFGNYPLACALAESRLKMILKSIAENGALSKIRFLDIGAGHGFLGLFWAGLNQVSDQVMLESYTVVEPDQVVTSSLQKTWNNKFRNVPLDIKMNLNQVDQKFYLIALSHILEHMISPENFLKQVMQKLEKDGLIFIEVPHRDDRFKASVFPHIHFFDQKSLSHLLVACQLEPLQFETFGRHMDDSPANYKRKKRIGFVLEIIVRKLRRVIPYGISKRFYSWYYGVSNKCEFGTWLRVLARKKSD